MAPLAVAPPAANDVDGAEVAPPPRPQKKLENPPAKKSGMSCAVPALVGLVVVWLLIFVGYRMVLRFTGAGFSPAGTTSDSGAGASSAATGDLGVDIYPGSRPVSEADHRNSPDRTVISQSFESSAKTDLVIDFYKARMVGQASIYASGSGVVVSISPNSQETIQVGIAPQPAGGTRFAITHTTEKGSQ